MAVTLLANGKSDFTDIDLYRNDSLFKTVLDLKKVPSSATFRRRLDELGKCNSTQTLLDKYIVNHLRKVSDFGKLATNGQYCLKIFSVQEMLFSTFLNVV